MCYMYDQLILVENNVKIKQRKDEDMSGCPNLTSLYCLNTNLQKAVSGNTKYLTLSDFAKLLWE